MLPDLDAWETAGAVPRALHRAAADAGLLGIGFPEEVGGQGGDLVDVVTVLEAMLAAGASSGLLAALFTHSIALPHLVAAGDPDLVERYVRPTLAGELIGSLAVSEPDAGSDVGALRTRAVRDGDSFVVDGTKTFITSGTRADFVTTAVRTGGPGARGSACWSSTGARPGSPSPGRWRRWAGTARTPRSWPTPAPGCRWATWSARRAAGSARSPGSSSPSGWRWPCTPTASPTARWR
ncbi:acyl-CoA dehydrogenase family protein [Klenkia terrae]|uniref:acyl-CoA dehydrogenase family protein n=1 Tax=Klenkia terrae TaxID=1052259 RepID=UPI003610F78B